MAFSTSALLSLALASLARAAPAFPTADLNTTDNRPWFLQELSAELVAAAVAIRSSSVPESEASAVAHTLVESALAHPHYTSIAQDAIDMWVNDGNYVNATSLLSIAKEAESAYQEIRTEPAYSSYIDYALSHASLYDFEALAPTPVYTRAGGDRERKFRAALTAAYASLISDPSGRAAVSTLHEVADGYLQDFVHDAKKTINVGKLENMLAYFYIQKPQRN